MTRRSESLNPRVRILVSLDIWLSVVLAGAGEQTVPQVEVRQAHALLSVHIAFALVAATLSAAPTGGLPCSTLSRAFGGAAPRRRNPVYRIAKRLYSKPNLELANI